MRIAYASDMHGSAELYQALLDLAASSGAGAAIVGGDLLPHVSRAADAISGQRRFIDGELRPMLERFRADHPGVEVYLLAGNDDWAAAVDGLGALEADGLARPLHGRCYELDGRGTWIAGYACVPPTPFSIKDYERPDAGSQRGAGFGQAFSSEGGAVRQLGAAEFYRRPSIGQELEALARLSDPARTVYVCHTPPAETPLDLMRGRRHVGSPGLRAFVERAGPPLTLHGHIHEAPEQSGQYACQIGRTWCVNAGRGERGLRAVTLDTDDIAGTIAHTSMGRPR